MNVTTMTAMEKKTMTIREWLMRQREARMAGTAAQEAAASLRKVRGATMGPEPEAEFPPDRPIPKSYDEALRGMANRPFLASQRYQEQQWRANREGAHPDILEFEKLLVRRMAKLGVPMFASEVIRTPERQDDLYALGTTKARAGQSPHQYGCAVDVVHSVHGWNLDQKAWALIGHVGKELAAQRGLKVTWGGEWSFYDPAHWELTHWRELKEAYPWPIRTK